MQGRKVLRVRGYEEAGPKNFADDIESGEPAGVGGAARGGAVRVLAAEDGAGVLYARHSVRHHGTRWRGHFRFCAEPGRDGRGQVTRLQPWSFPFALHRLDVNYDGGVTAAAVQAEVNDVTGKTTHANTDLNSDSATDVRDVQISATAATPPNFVCNAH